MQNSNPAGPEQSAATEQAGLIDALAQTSFVTTALLTKVAAEHDMSLTQLRMLAILRDRRLKMTELAGLLGLDKSSLTGLVDRAEKKGLLQRVRNPVDGRAVDVRISPSGSEFAAQVYVVVSQALSPMIQTLSSADQRRLRTLLEALLGG